MVKLRATLCLQLEARVWGTFLMNASTIKMSIKEKGANESIIDEPSEKLVPPS
jgi:hypothetical protein